MSVTAAIRFPLGHYHATPWDRSVNEGAVEWPPSPWRLLRSLVATWYTRWPDLPAPVLDELLERLGTPPSYLPPEVTAGHTRHYLPDLDRQRGRTGDTDLALDPFVRLERDAELLVRWEADLTGEQWAVLAKLLELVPYLGRAESVCQARLLEPGSEPAPDQRWWRPTPDGAAGQVRLLAPVRPVRRPVLELSTLAVRKGRRTVPPDTEWVGYAPPAYGGAAAAPGPVRELARVDAVRFAVMYRAPVRNSHGVLLADEVHRLVTKALDGGRAEVVGHAGATTDHHHAHWLPLAAGTAAGAPVESVVIWVSGGLTQPEVATILGDTKLRRISGRRGDYDVKGFPEVDLRLQAVGQLQTVAPELCRPARRWRSLTPYLPVRHRKRETLDDYVAADVRTELRYRGIGTEVTVCRLRASEGLSDRWGQDFRRYRMRERLRHARRGLGLRLEFEAEVEGPLLLGQLSHFGYGMFVPDSDPPDQASGV